MRILVVGCGGRGCALARELISEGHVVRGTTRSEQGRTAIEAAGAECYVGDPDRVGTLIGALQGVTVVCWLLGSARGTPEELSALHGTRLEMALERMIDTGIRGFLYEAAGSVSAGLLEEGREFVRRACEHSHIPVQFLAVDPADREEWIAEAKSLVGVLGAV